MIQVHQNVKVRYIDMTIDTDLEYFPIVNRAIESGAFHKSPYGGPDGKNRTRLIFMIGEEYADTFLAEFEALDKENAK